MMGNLKDSQKKNAIEFNERIYYERYSTPFGVAPTRFSLCRELLLTVTKSKVLRTFASYKMCLWKSLLISSNEGLEIQVSKKYFT